MAQKTVGRGRGTGDKSKVSGPGVNTATRMKGVRRLTAKQMSDMNIGHAGSFRARGAPNAGRGGPKKGK